MDLCFTSQAPRISGSQIHSEAGSVIVKVLFLFAYHTRVHFGREADAPEKLNIDLQDVNVDPMYVRS